MSQRNYAHRQRLRAIKGRRPRPERLYTLEPHEHGGFVVELEDRRRVLIPDARGYGQVVDYVMDLGR